MKKITKKQQVPGSKDYKYKDKQSCPEPDKLQLFKYALNGFYLHDITVKIWETGKRKAVKIRKTGKI